MYVFVCGVVFVVFVCCVCVCMCVCVLFSFSSFLDFLFMVGQNIHVCVFVVCLFRVCCVPVLHVCLFVCVCSIFLLFS
jgi:hypothetical protein